MKEYIERDNAFDFSKPIRYKLSANDAEKTAWMVLNGLGYRCEENSQLWKSVSAVFDTAPAADVRPVVTCGECMYAPAGTDSGENQGFSLEWPHDKWPEDNPCPCKCADGWYSHKPKPDFFCANGKREES